MGGTEYNFVARAASPRAKKYKTASMNTVFSQNTIGVAHDTMNSRQIDFREARDSDIHPVSFPIILGLDVTGSMRRIPHYLIKEGLPKLMNMIIDGGQEHPAILLTAIGDHLNDTEPLQIGQFESGDEELDMWLERLYLEGRGGGNNGESYSLVHYFAANHCVTDHWDKRNQKGLIITIGDEPTHGNYSNYDIERILGDGDVGSFTAVEAFQKANEKWNIYHIVPVREKYPDTIMLWNSLIGEQNVIFAESQEEIPQIITNIVLENSNLSTSTANNITVTEEIL